LIKVSRFASRRAFRFAVAACLGSIAAHGCGGPEPTYVFKVPEGASAREIQPGKPTPPPKYRPSNLPAPPPGHPNDLNRPR